jgi:hypothetical protein
MLLLGMVGRLIRGSKDALATLGKVSSAQGEMRPPRTSRWGDVVVGVARRPRGVEWVFVCVSNFPVDGGVRVRGADQAEGRSTISVVSCLVQRVVVSILS